VHELHIEVLAAEAGVLAVERAWQAAALGKARIGSLAVVRTFLYISLQTN